MVTVVRASVRWFVPHWFYWFLLLLLIPIIILVTARYYSRKRRKRAKEAFYSGCTAWYYGWNMRKGTSETQDQMNIKTFQVLFLEAKK